MGKLLNILKKYKRIILIPLFFILMLTALFQLYEIRFRFHITAKFAKSGPLYKHMPVYYKGYKIGETTRVKISKDYKYTLAKIMLYPREPKLPDNIIAKVKKHCAKKDYIDLMTQYEPSTTFLKNKSVIDGEGAFDIDAFLSEIADSKMIIPLIQTATDTLTSLDKTSAEIKSFFSDARFMLKDNKQNLKQTTKTLKEITSKLNNSIEEDKLKNTISSADRSSTNILSATENIKNITSNIDNATKNIGKTITKIDCTVSKANCIASDVKVMTRGLRKTMEKRFAGLRIIFGKPINNKCPTKYTGK